MSTPPLNGLKVIEFAGLAPGPFAGLVLADWGASVTRIDRADQRSSTDVLSRGKRSIAVDLKAAAGRELLLKMIAHADVVIDPFRPGVLEKLGLGPDVFLGDGGLNKRLIFARLSGFSPTGPHKDMAGHDINYAALSGVLSMLPGTAEKPTFPLNLLADFAGGGLICALGILLAVIARNSSPSGAGQVVSTDMVSGARYVSSFPLLHVLVPNSPTFGLGADRGTKTLDGGAPFYNVYTCSDGAWMSVGCIEPQFFDIFIAKFVEALPTKFLAAQEGWRPTSAMRTEQSHWPRLRRFLEEGFKTRTRDDWAQTFHATDACAVPVLTPSEAGKLAHSAVPEPHPKLLRTTAVPFVKDAAVSLALTPGQHTVDILREMGLTRQEMNELVASKALGSIKSKL